MIRLTGILREIIVKPSNFASVEVLKKKFERMYPPVSLNVGRKAVKGRGEIINYNELPNLSDYLNKTFTLEPQSDLQSQKWTKDSWIRWLNHIGRISKSVGNYFNITWTKIAFFPQFTAYDRLDGEVNGSFNIYSCAVLGIDDKSRDFILTINGNDAADLITATGKASLRSIPNDFNFASPLRLQALLQKLFPDKAAKQDKVPNVRTLTQAPDAKQVSMKFGKRIRRGGPGIEGSYTDLNKYLTLTSQENLIAAAKKNNLTWKNMIIYDEGGDTLFAALGTDPAGQYYMWDRAGHGPGSYSRLRGPLLKTEL